jgi:cytochrome c oxidase cbb3-type subunit 4
MTMDINLVRSLMTLVMFCIFVGIVAWAWSGRQRGRFAEAARIPLEDDGVPTARTRE